DYIKSQSSDGQIIVLADSLQSEILNEILTETKVNPVPVVTSLKSISEMTSQAETLILPGIWRSYDEVALFSHLSEKIEIISYTAEFFSIEAAINRINDFGEPDTLECLEALGFKDNQVVASKFEWLRLDEKSRQEVNNAKS